MISLYCSEIYKIYKIFLDKYQNQFLLCTIVLTELLNFRSVLCLLSRCSWISKERIIGKNYFLVQENELTKERGKCFLN